MPSDSASYFSAPDIPLRTLHLLKTELDRIRSSHARALAELDAMRGHSRSRHFGAKLSASLVLLESDVTAVIGSFGLDSGSSAEHTALLRSMEELAAKLAAIPETLHSGHGAAAGAKGLSLSRNIEDAFRSPLSILDFLIAERERAATRSPRRSQRKCREANPLF